MTTPTQLIEQLVGALENHSGNYKLTNTEAQLKAAILTAARAYLEQTQASEPAFNPDWSLLEAAQESLREHMAMVKATEPAPSTAGERAEVVANLLMYAGDNGYGHIDYADTMRHAAALLQSTAAQTERVEPTAPKFFCGVDINDGILSVSVLQRCPDGVAELVHLEEMTLPPTEPRQAVPEASKQGWLPIESAPKDGTTIDLWHEEFGREADCYWGLPIHSCGEAGRLCDDEFHDLEPQWINTFNSPAFPESEYTHWMPLPAAPSTGEQTP
jgi:hypothetical protein